MADCSDLGSQDYVKLYKPTLIMPTIEGMITLDEAAANSLVDRLCVLFGPCIAEKVMEMLSAGTYNINVHDVEIQHKIIFSDEARQHFINDICEYLKPCIRASLKFEVIEDVTLERPIINNATLDDNTINSILKALTLEPHVSFLANKLCAVLGPCITSHVNGGDFTGVTLTSGMILNTTINGSLIEHTTFEYNTFSGTNTFAGEFILTEAARLSLCAAVKSCVLTWISEELEKALSIVWEALAILEARVDKQDNIIDELWRIIWEIRCLTTDIVTCDGEIRGDRRLTTCDQTQDIVDKTIEEMETCDGSPLGLRTITACEQMWAYVEQEIKAQLTCDDTPIDSRKIVECEQMKAYVKEQIDAQPTCDESPLNGRPTPTCGQMDAAIIEVVTAAIRSQLTCDDTALNGRKLVECSQMTAAFQAQKTCDDTPLGTRAIVACDQLEREIKQNTGSHKIYQKTFVINNALPTVKLVNTSITLEQDSVVYITSFGYTNGGGSQTGWHSATTIFVDGTTSPYEIGYPYAHGIFIDPDDPSPAPKFAQAEHLFVTPDALLIANIGSRGWYDLPKISKGRPLTAGIHNIVARYDWGVGSAYIIGGFIRVDVIPASNISTLTVTNT